MDKSAVASRLRDLIDAAAEGDKAAFEQLYRLTNRRVYGAVLRILRKRDLAAIAAEKAYLRIWREAAEFSPDFHSPSNWIAMVAREVALDAARENDDVRVSGYWETAEHDAMPDEAPQNDISPELKKLLAAIGELSSDLRRMLLLIYYDGWSKDALSVEFDAPPGTIRTWLLRSLEHIRAKVPV